MIKNQWDIMHYFLTGGPVGAFFGTKKDMYMLYHINELKNAALWPAHLASEATSSLLDLIDHDMENPYVRFLAATNALVERTTRVFDKPKFNIEYVNRGKYRLKVSEVDILPKAFCNLKYFNREVPRGKKEKELDQDPIVLIVAPLSGHFATLLRDTAMAMIPYHQTYITDWEDSKRIPLSEGDFDLDQYVEYLLDFIRALYTRHGGRRIHVMAVCQPSMPVLMAASLLASYNEPCQLASMTLMGGPIDTRINPGKVNVFASSHSIEWFRENILMKVPSYYPGVGRLVCPGFVLLSGFMSLNIERHQEASQKFFKHLVQGDLDGAHAHSRFYDEYRSVMDVPGKYFVESIEHSFQKHSLAMGTMTWRGYPIDPSAIRHTGLMTVEGELDDISCVGQTLAAHGLCNNLSASRHHQYYQQGVGHYGIFNGSRWRGSIQPQIAKFIMEQEVLSR